MNRKALVVGAAIIGVLAGPAMASKSARSMSAAGQAPGVWDHEPGPNARLEQFQVVMVDDHTCPAGQIKKFTAGSRRLGVHATRECVAR